MVALEDFKAEVDKFIHFMNERLKTYHLDTDEEYDVVIDNLVLEYYRNESKALVFCDIYGYEDPLDEIDRNEPFSIGHSYDGAWAGEQRDNSYPREHTCYADSEDGRYDAVIKTIDVIAKPPSGWLFKELISKTNLFIPQFFLQYITDNKTYKQHYEADYKSVKYGR
jgi:hypothetical protein